MIYMKHQIIFPCITLVVAPYTRRITRTGKYASAFYLTHEVHAIQTPAVYQRAEMLLP